MAFDLLPSVPLGSKRKLQLAASHEDACDFFYHHRTTTKKQTNSNHQKNKNLKNFRKALQCIACLAPKRAGMVLNKVCSSCFDVFLRHLRNYQRHHNNKTTFPHKHLVAENPTRKLTQGRSRFSPLRQDDFLGFLDRCFVFERLITKGTQRGMEKIASHDGLWRLGLHAASSVVEEGVQTFNEHEGTLDHHDCDLLNIAIVETTTSSGEISFDRVEDSISECNSSHHVQFSSGGAVDLDSLKLKYLSDLETARIKAGELQSKYAETPKIEPTEKAIQIILDVADECQEEMCLPSVFTLVLSLPSTLQESIDKVLWSLGLSSTDFKMEVCEWSTDQGSERLCHQDLMLAGLKGEQHMLEKGLRSLTVRLSKV